MIAALHARDRLLPPMAIAATLILLVAGVAAVLYEEHSYKTHKVYDANVQAHILASIVTAALAFQDRKEAQEYVNAFRSDADVQGVAIYDHSGKLFVQYGRPGANLPYLFLDAMPSQKNILVTIAPVRQRDMTLGTVYLQTQMEPLARRLTLYSVIAIFVAMGAMVVTVLTLAYLAAKRANAELARRAEALSESNTKLLGQIAAREKAENALLHAQKMEAMGQMTGGLAHDFNNLLQIVNLNLSLLKWSPLVRADADLREATEIGLKAIERGASLTKQLLAFGRRQPLATRVFDVNQLVEQMTQLMTRAMGETIRIELDLAPDLWPASADPHQLEGALLNLAINARDAMPSGGILSINTSNSSINTGNGPDEALAEVQAAGDYVRIAVTDNGCGMSPGVIEKAFEPFFSTKGVGKGTGLGLSQVYGYAKQSGGDVTIASTEGAGTTVTLILPRALAAPAPVSSSTATIAPAPTTTETVLVVEDEALVRFSAVSSLKRLGYRVLAADNAAAALAILESDESIDILFSDVVMPGDKNGVTLAQEAMRSHPSLKVLLTSGYMALDVFDAPDMAAFPLLSKPYGYEDLAAAISHLNSPHRVVADVVVGS